MMLFRALALLLALSSSALAQSGQIPTGTVWGNAGASKAVASPSTVTSILDRAFTGAQGMIINRGASAWAATRTPVLGLAGSAVGSLGFANATSGTETIQPVTGALGSGVAFLPAGTYNIVGDSLTQTLTTKVINCANNTCTVRLASDVTGQLPIGNGGTGQTTAPNAITALMPTPTRAGDLGFWNGTIWTTLPGNNSGTQVLQETSAGVPSWVAAGTGTVTTLTPGAGLVSSVTAGCSQTNITTTGTLSESNCINAQVGTSYTVVDGDRAKLITASNAAAQAYQIAQAGTASAFQSGWFTTIENISASGSAGIVTLTPTTSTIKVNGVAQSTLVIYPGQSGRLVSDGTNYIWVTAGGSNWVLLNTLTASASANLQDTSSLTAAFSEYEIEFANLVTNTANTSAILLVHSGGSFQLTSYVNSIFGGANGVFTGNAADVTSVQLGAAAQNTVVPGFSGYIRVAAPSSTATPKYWIGPAIFNNNSSGFTTLSIGGAWNSNAAVDGFEFCFSTTSPSCAGLITSGTIKIYGRL